MMALNPQEELYLIDKNGQRLGSVAIRRIEGDRLFGRFRADKGFAAVESLFERFENAANDQLFHEVDRIGEEIERLGMQLVSKDADDALRLEDVQIMRGADFACQVPNLQLIQPTPAAVIAGT
jgi:hypothetical protein